MGITLGAIAREAEFLDLSYSGWADLLKLAHDHGWEPAGVVPFQGDEEWGARTVHPMNYSTSDWQTITAGDARGIATGLRAAADKLPEWARERPGLLRVADWLDLSGGVCLS
jgi:hypothetical protein